MITIGSMKDLKRNTYDEIWFIIRSTDWMNNESIFKNKNVFHVPALSPTKDLFHWYLNLKKNNKWTPHMFDTQYVPRFLKRLAYSKEAHRELNLLWFKSKHGKNILLVCPCPDESMCHRSIIGGMLLGAGVNVVSTTCDINNYERFYNLYKQSLSELQ